MEITKKKIVFLFILVFVISIVRGGSLVWPTPNPAFARGDEWESFIQPTASGNPDSGLFGCVRNNGHRFHEALDIAPYWKRKYGEPTDAIYAVMTGRIMHVSNVAGNSSYGRYIVMEHPVTGIPIYTLYAHLSSIEKGIEPGNIVEAGSVLGVMGRSASGYVIQKAQAHLHFEIGIRISDTFKEWYDRKEFGSENEHGNFNGMNLVGWEPLDFFKKQLGKESVDAINYIQTIDPGFVLKIRTSMVPELLKRMPELWTGGEELNKLSGWEITFSAWGLPLAFRSLGVEDIQRLGVPGEISVIAVNRKALKFYECREMVDFSGTVISLGQAGRDLMELIFTGASPAAGRKATR